VKRRRKNPVPVKNVLSNATTAGMSAFLYARGQAEQGPPTTSSQRKFSSSKCCCLSISIGDRMLSEANPASQ
jgi:hypothetical protein